MNAHLDAFLDTTQAVLPAFAALRLRASDNEFRDRPEFFLSVKARLHKLTPAHPWLAELDYFMDASRLPVLVGEKMPDFALPNPQGDTIRLSNVLSSLVLVDFWASWCAPCRRETKEFIRPLYDQYHSKGFNVLGISIDAGKESWENAIQRDGAIWYQTCDLMGDASPVRSDLKFEYIPSNYLLDSSGKLLARNLHGEELKAFVEGFFK
jgi:thiol-disulfide isomerase/thioredoxin